MAFPVYLRAKIEMGIAPKNEVMKNPSRLETDRGLVTWNGNPIHCMAGRQMVDKKSVKLR